MLIYIRIYMHMRVRICVNLSIYYIFKHLQNTTEKVSRCKICNLCEGDRPQKQINQNKRNGITNTPYKKEAEKNLNE